MRFAHPQNTRRGAFLFIALFSCLQITFGFFLLTGNEHDYVAPIQIANIARQANLFEPASGEAILVNPPMTDDKKSPRFLSYKIKINDPSSADYHDDEEMFFINTLTNEQE